MSEKMITLTIDGKKVQVENGKTVLQACRDNSIEIPTLCYDPHLPPAGSCLLCVVEIEGHKKLPLSCTTQASDGMVVKTNSHAIYKSRKNALEMLLSNHYADCRGPCYQSCPADVDVQAYLTFAKDGKFKEALDVVVETNPFPLICGRVCVRYCEASCRRNDVDSPVAINFIKRYIADLKSDKLPELEKVPFNGKKVAIIGGGPAGLTAAHFLAKKGYQIKILERHPKLGGMLRYGIPDYRLPQDVIDNEINRIIANGVEVETGVSWGKDFKLKDLQKQGYEAIFITIGAQAAKSMRIKNEELTGIESGIHYLERVKKDGIPEMKGTALIVGGGNTAVDAARTAIRTGASDVRILYRRTLDEMPADDVEVRDALEEGVNIDYLVAPLEAIERNGKLSALKCQKMMLGEPDASGRRRPVPIEGSEYEISCNYIISAIGQDVQGKKMVEDDSLGKLNLTRWGSIDADENTYATNVEGIFAAGDAVTGPMAAVDAIGAGRKATDVIDIYLQEGRIFNPHFEFISRKENLARIPKAYFDTLEKIERSKMKQKDPFQRVNDFEEVDLGISAEDVLKEATRCLTCGCSDVYTCDLKKYSTEYGVSQTRFQGGKVNKYQEDISHPFVKRDPNKCILCGRCVRTCENILGVGALGFISRGSEMIVKPSMGKELKDTNCISCGNCIDVCPTGAISYSVMEEHPWFNEIQQKESVCNNCGEGCTLVFNKRDEDYWYITGKERESKLQDRLCKRGRFYQRYNLKENRLHDALLKVDGKHEQVTVAKAIKEATSNMKKMLEKYGPEGVAVLVSPRSTNEELYLASKIARDNLKTNNIASLDDIESRDPNWPAGFMKHLNSTADYEDFRHADAVVLINADICRSNPVMGFDLVSAFKSGKTIFSISSVQTTTTKFASQWINNRRGTTSLVLYEALRRAMKLNPEIEKTLIPKKLDGDKLLKSIEGLDSNVMDMIGLDHAELDPLAEILADQSKKVVFVYAPQSNLDKAYGDLFATYNVLMATGRCQNDKHGILFSYEHSNMQGYFNLGVYPEATTNNDCLSGYKEIAGSKTGIELKKAFDDGKIKAVMLLGENPSGEKTWDNIISSMEYVAKVDMYQSDAMEFADVAIPGTGYAESTGSITTQENKIKSFAPAFTPKNNIDGFEVLSEIYNNLGGKKLSIGDVRKMMAKEHPRYSALANIKAGGHERVKSLEKRGTRFYMVNLDQNQIIRRKLPTFSTISKIADRA